MLRWITVGTPFIHLTKGRPSLRILGSVARLGARAASFTSHFICLNEIAPPRYRRLLRRATIGPRRHATKQRD
jgi:hypothetical protein